MKKIDIKGIAIKAASVGAGGYAAVKVNKVEALAKMKPAMRGALKMAIGALLPTLMKGKKMDMLAGVGDGFIAIGAVECAAAFDDTMPSLLDAETTQKLAAAEAASGGAVKGIPTLGSVGQVIYDEDYSNLTNVGAVPTMGGSVMGSTDDDYSL